MRSKGSKYYTTEPTKTKVTLTKSHNGCSRIVAKPNVWWRRGQRWGIGIDDGRPMGATGAAGAGAAADPNMQLQALMSLRQVRMSERKNEAEINLT